MTSDKAGRTGKRVARLVVAPPSNGDELTHAMAVCRANGFEPRKADDLRRDDNELAELRGQYEVASMELAAFRADGTLALLRRDKARAGDVIRAATRMRHALERWQPANADVVLAKQELERTLDAYDGGDGG